MPRTRAPYPPEFKAEAVRLASSGVKSLPALAVDLGISAEALRSWLCQRMLTRTVVGPATGRCHPSPAAVVDDAAAGPGLVSVS
jgi:transposase-like protein